MSLLIKGLKMPKKEDELLCIRIYPSGKVTIDMDLQCKQVAESVELPDHGRLVDVDEMERLFLEATGVSISFNGVPTVIPAERSEASLCDNCDERSDVGCSWCKRMESSDDGET